MKQLTLALLWCIPIFVFGQNESIDTAFFDNINSSLRYAEQLSNQNKFQEALDLTIEVDSLVKDKFGTDVPFYGEICTHYGLRYYAMGHYVKAAEWWAQTIEVLDKNDLNKDEEYAQSLNRLFVAYWLSGKLDKAEKIGLRTQAIWEELLGKNNIPYAGTLVNLASLYRSMLQYDKGEQLFSEAISIFEDSLQNQSHRYYVTCLSNLATSYNETGQYKEAESLYLKLKDIHESNPDYKKNILYFDFLINLSNLYQNMGNNKYESILFEVKDLFEKSIGKNHAGYATILINVSKFYSRNRQLDQAESTLMEAKDILETSLKMTETSDYIGCLQNLGELYQHKGNFDKAKTYYLKSNELREKIQGKESPIYATGLSDLADLYSNTGNDKEAETLLLEAKNILERVVGKNRQYSRVSHYLANLYIKEGRYTEAETLFQELAPINKSFALEGSSYLSEQELDQYLKIFIPYQNQILDFTSLSLNTCPQMAQICYDNTLFYKGFILNASNKIRRLALNDPTTQDKFKLLASYKRRIAREYTLPLGERDSTGLIELEEKVNTIEKELSRTVNDYDKSIRQFKWEDVQKQLGSEEAAIEFVHYRIKDKEATYQTMYAALLLLPSSQKPLFISLFDEKQLDQLFIKQNKDKAATINNLYDNNSLYRLLWKPLSKELKDIKTLYYSPSGLLHRVNLSAIKMNEEVSLGNQYKLVHVNSTRQLITDHQTATKDNASKTVSSNALLFGGIQYDMDSTAIASTNKAYKKTASRSLLQFDPTDNTLRGDKWDYLDWTEIEVAAIQSILKENNITTKLQDGYKATEEAFKSIHQPSPRILHIATHGFFFPDPAQKASSLEVENESDLIFKISEHPMIRSGLIMAGGNHAWKTGKPIKPAMEDGILTAYEISQMDLSNTELVVLSACETGLGDIEGNEGVYGLQRAFKIAGAKYLIMSLWQVPDYQTQQLMTTFYKKWLTDKMSIPDAFSSAQSEMQEKYKDPFLWAGFVLVE